VKTFENSDQVQNATGPLLIEVAKPPGSSLGVTLSVTVINHRHVIVISDVRSASIADRCGALHVGDQVLRIDSHAVENLTLDDASRLLSSPSDQIKLEILPVSHVRLAIEGPKSLTYPQNRYTNSIAPSNSMSGLNTFSRMNTLRSSGQSNTFSRMNSRNRGRLRSGQSSMSIASYDVGYQNPNQVYLSNTALHQVGVIHMVFGADKEPHIKALWVVLNHTTQKNFYWWGDFWKTKIDFQTKFRFWEQNLDFWTKFRFLGKF